MLKTLYTSRTGGYVLRIITRPGFSRRCAGVLDSRYSRMYIKRFIHKNDIDMSEYETKRWNSFNDFFTRQIKPDARPVDTDPAALISPCDSVLSAYTINADSVFTVKDVEYTLASLLENPDLAAKYRGGMCMIFRMMPVNYHRYIYPDGGVEGACSAIRGRLHTVRPVAQKKYNVYVTNSREYTVLKTHNFDEVVFMEVGALMVGRIVNHHASGVFRRGDEKGFFEYGGSTIIMLLRQGTAHLDGEYAACLDSGIEIPVKMGQRVGAKNDA